MSKINECFVCGMLLAATEKHFLEVEDPTFKTMKAECCSRCWWRVRSEMGALVVKGKVTYVVYVRMAQGDLFSKTFRKLIRGGEDRG